MSDRVTVGLTPEGERQLAQVMESRFFTEELTAYRVAIAVALAEDEVTPREEMKNVRTKFNVGSLEEEGRLRDIVELVKPHASGEGVMNLAERLADAGIKIIAREVERGTPLRDLLLKGLSSE